MNSVNKVTLLHPKIKTEVAFFVDTANKQLTGRSKMIIVQGLRTFDEQNLLYAQGRTKPGPIVTKAKGGQSLHNYGLAIDFCLLIDGVKTSWDMKTDWNGNKIADWMEVVKVFKAAGYEWGGDWHFTDNPHFQKTFGHHWQDLLIKYNSGDFIDGTKYVNI